MAQVEGLSLLRPRKIGVHRAQIALGVKRIVAILRQVQRDLADAVGGMHIAGDIVDIHVPRIVFNDQPGVARYLDAVFELKVTDAEKQTRQHRMLRELGGDGEFITRAFGDQADAVQALFGAAAIFRW